MSTRSLLFRAAPGAAVHAADAIRRGEADEAAQLPSYPQVQSLTAVGSF